MEQAVAFTPWRSIRDGAVGVSERPLGAAEALESPCASCTSSPCCSHLPLHSFTVSTVADFSYVAYLLNFDRIRLGLAPTGEWSAYYVEPCRFLDRNDFSCTIHNTPEQPQICVSYNPHSCWYKRVLTTSVSEEFLLVDRSRYERLAELVEFNELRQLTDFPSWEVLMAEFAPLSDPPQVEANAPLPDLGWDAWTKVILQPTPEKPEAKVFGYTDNAAPCSDCSAPCCETLTFAQGIPNTRSALDYMRFSLGFPGIELTVADDGWWITVKSTCRHLVDGACSIYGQPERPLTCSYYDAWKCTYKREFAGPPPDDIVRVRHDTFMSLVSRIGFDEHGGVVHMPPVAELRSVVEQDMVQAQLHA